MSPLYHKRKTYICIDLNYSASLQITIPTNVYALIGANEKCCRGCFPIYMLQQFARKASPLILYFEHTCTKTTFQYHSRSSSSTTCNEHEHILVAQDILHLIIKQHIQLLLMPIQTLVYAIRFSIKWVSLAHNKHHYYLQNMTLSLSIGHGNAQHVHHQIFAHRDNITRGQVVACILQHHTSHKSDVNDSENVGFIHKGQI